MNARDRGFYGGILTALQVISAFGQSAIIEEIMGTLDEDGERELIQYAKDNGEYTLSGLDEYEAHKAGAR